jgi:hypothetical protein
LWQWTDRSREAKETVMLEFMSRLIVFPLAGLLSMIWMLAGYAMAFGVSLIVLGVRLRRRAGASADVGHFDHAVAAR